MEKLDSLFRFYTRVPSSPSMGAIRRNSSPRTFRYALIVGAIVLSCSLLILSSHNHEQIARRLPKAFQTGQLLASSTSDEKTNSTPDRFGLSDATVAQVQNSSLGFERVIMVNLPKRTDKLDSSSLAASLTGFNFSIVPGVRNDDVDPVSLPWNFKPEEAKVRGCWRAHLNAVRTIVTQGLSSALIIEDDSDWDVNLKSQLLPIAAGTQKLLNTASSKMPHSPYGDDWDLLWLGHCASELRTDSSRMLIHNDKTVRPPSKAWNMWTAGFNRYGPGMTNSTRVVSRGNNAICMNAYALSFKGAQKLLYYASYMPNPDAIDTRINHICDAKNKNEYPNFDCLHVYPPIFNAYRKAGRADGDSDQSDGGKKKPAEVKMRENGYAYNNVYSTMLNLGNLLLGKEPEMQWPLDGWEKERELDESRGMELEWQESGWAKFGKGVADEKPVEEMKEREHER